MKCIVSGNESEPPSRPSIGLIVYREQLGCTRNQEGECTGMLSGELWLFSLSVAGIRGRV